MQAATGYPMDDPAERGLAGDADVLRLLFQEAQDGIFILDQRGRVIEANNAFAAMLGRRAEEVIGLQPWDWDLVYSREEVLANIPLMTERMTFETRIRRKDDGIFDAEIGSSPVEIGGRSYLFMVCRDVTKRKLAERALQESEQRLRTIIETEPECVKLLGPDGRLLDMNPAGLAMLEASSLAELQRRPLLDLIVPEYRRAFADLHRRVMGGATARLEFEAVGLKGNHRWLETHAAPMRDSTGKVMVVLGITRDVTDRRKSESAAREAAERLQMAIEAGNVGLWDWDILTNQVYHSPEWKRQLGYEADELVDSCPEWESRLHPDDRERVVSVVRRFLENPQLGYQNEFRLRHKDGSYRWIAAQGALSCDEQGRPVRMLGSHVEITARKQAEEALREAEARFASFMDANPAIAWAKDRTGRFVYMNKTWADTFRVRIEDWIGKTTFDRQPADVASRLWENDLAVFKSGKPMEFIEETVESDGTKRVWRTFKFPFSTTPGQQLIGGIAIDITKHREVEDQLRQSQKLEAIGQLTGGVAHDFNNLLMIIMGNLDILREVAEPAVGKRPEIEAAIRAARRGADLTQRLLAFARHQVLAPQPVHVNELVTGALLLFRRTLGEAIHITAVTRAGFDVATVDPGQLENALMNLAVNARDAMPDGGHLTISTDRVHLREGDTLEGVAVVPGCYLVITVRDSGSGMPPEILSRAFDPFFTTKEVGKGTGLGLSMVHGFAKQSRGYVEIESRVDEGTAVKLYLPCAEDQAQPRPAPESPRQGRSERIAVIEDDPGVRQTVLQQLKRLGYDPCSFGDGADVLARVDEFERIDLLLSDIALPGGKSGVGIAEELVRVHPRLRMLFMSGYPGHPTVEERIAELGGKLLPKPFTTAQLSRAIGEAFEKADERPLCG